VNPEPEFFGGLGARHCQHVFGAFQNFFQGGATISGNCGGCSFQFANDAANEFLWV